jgi:hypothetical protein
MSQATATDPARRPARRRQVASRQRLRVVQGRAAARRGWFPVVCVSLLAGGLLAVLVLNAALAQGSFELGRLQATSSELADQQESLTQSIDEQRSPEQLASRARALGMVPATAAAFLRLSDGKVLGVAKPASSEDGFSVATTPGSGSAAPAAPTTGASGGSTETGRDDKGETKNDSGRDSRSDPKKKADGADQEDGTKTNGDGDQRGTADAGTDGTTPGTADRTSGGGATDSATEGP